MGDTETNEQREESLQQMREQEHKQCSVEDPEIVEYNMYKAFSLSTGCMC